MSRFANVMYFDIGARDNAFSRRIESNHRIQSLLRMILSRAEYVGDSESDGLQGVRSASGKIELMHSNIPGGLRCMSHQVQVHQLVYSRLNLKTFSQRPTIIEICANETMSTSTDMIHYKTFIIIFFRLICSCRSQRCCQMLTFLVVGFVKNAGE